MPQHTRVPKQRVQPITFKVGHAFFTMVTTLLSLELTLDDLESKLSEKVRSGMSRAKNGGVLRHFFHYLPNKNSFSSSLRLFSFCIDELNLGRTETSMSAGAGKWRGGTGPCP